MDLIGKVAKEIDDALLAGHRGPRFSRALATLILSIPEVKDALDYYDRRSPLERAEAEATRPKFTGGGV